MHRAHYNIVLTVCQWIFKLPCKKNNDRSIINVQKSFLNKSYNEKVKENEEKKSFIKLEKNIHEIVISDLYDKLIYGKNLNKNSLKHISKYTEENACIEVTSELFASF